MFVFLSHTIVLFETKLKEKLKNVKCVFFLRFMISSFLMIQAGFEVVSHLDSQDFFFLIVEAGQELRDGLLPQVAGRWAHEELV